MYDEDADAGDISLSLGTSRSSPQISITRDPLDPNDSGVNNISIDTSPSPAGPYTAHAHREVTSPTPRRFLGKGLWTKPQPSTSTESTLITARHQSANSSIWLNDSPLSKLDAHDDDDDDVDTPLASSSFWGTDRRPSSAVPPTKTNPSSPSPFTRRISSSGTLTRSRSLNLRMPSVDLSVDTLGPHSRSPLSATARTPSMRIGWNRRPGEPRPPPLVTDHVGDRMSRWVKEILVCNFDLERGPVVERKVLGRRWGPGEKENVAFSSFPDTSLFAEGSIMFSFKIRHIPPDPSTLSYPEPPSPLPDRKAPSLEQGLLDVSPSHVGSNSPLPSPSGPMSTGEKAAEYRKWDERGREWLYGFVWFEQRRDKGIARGYMQKSLVILTHLPFPSLFSAVLHRVASTFFEHGYSALEAACHSIASWPDPRPDTILELPFMSEIITVKLPDTNETPQVGKSFGLPSPERPLLASLPTSTPLRTFAPFLSSLWSLWECLILAEPILVIAPDPRTCSEIIWWLRDLLRPFPPAGDFRPYLHIHDHDFSLLVNSGKPQAGVVVGVTNPFFRNAASHWPNVISLSTDKPKRVVANGTAPSPALKPTQPDGFISRRHRSVSKDRVLLKRLEALVAEGKHDDPSANEALRTHFQQLTEKMLVPLNRYFQTLVPTISPSPSPYPSTFSINSSSGNSSSGLSISSLKPFSLPSFLAHLKTRGPNPLSFRTRGLTSKSRVESDFYASFCMSATFAGWLAARVESLGLAVAAQSSNSNANSNSTTTTTLAVPTDITPTKSRPSVSVCTHPDTVELGIVASMGDLTVRGAGAESPPRTRVSSEASASASPSDTRLSSDGSSVGRW